MKPLYSSEEVRAQDRRVIEDFGMPSHTLMEIAGRECANFIHRSFRCSTVSIFCGSGNNGGDGYVIARWLCLWGWTVTIVAVSEPKTSDAILNKRLLPKDVFVTQRPKRSDLYIDALLGTGQQRALSGSYAEAVQWLREQDQQIISIDVPTGRCPDRGTPFGEAYLSPAICLSIGLLKKGLYSLSYGMVIHEIDIGLQLGGDPPAQNYLLEERDIVKRFPVHGSDIAKWDKGHVAIYARGGAAVLTAHAALLAGAGLVTILCPQNEWSNLFALRPEVMVKTPEALDYRRHDALVVGPNCGFSVESQNFILHCWQKYPNPMVVDADAIRIIAENKPKESSYCRVLTPHISEASHILNIEKGLIKERPYNAVEQLQRYGLSILKGPYTKISSQPTYVNPTGSNRLAIAGSGDILSGLVGGLMAQRLSAIDSLIVSCYLHGLAGEKLNFGDSASSLIEVLSTLFQRIDQLKST